MNRLFCITLTALILGAFPLLTGCGSESTESTATGPTAQDGLRDLAEMLKGLAKTNGKPPAKPADAVRLEGPHPAAHSELMNKSLVYLWGNGIDPASTDIIAYESKAETDGGWVLLQNGELKQMSAEEFKAAPKAKKK